jgi:hypothetical protein
MVSENRALDAQLSAHCHAHRSCPSGAPPAWESQTATAMDRCIASASLTMTQLGSHRALGRAARRRQQQQSDHPASVGAFRPASVGALGSARSRRVWELLAPTMDKAALSSEPLGNANAPTDTPSRGFSLLDSSAGTRTPLWRTHLRAAPPRRGVFVDTTDAHTDIVRRRARNSSCCCRTIRLDRDDSIHPEQCRRAWLRGDSD